VADYQLYYWSGIPGRGEPIRLAFEEAGVAYDDVARGPEGNKVIARVLAGELGGLKPFAPPVLKHGDVVVSHVAAILQYIAPRIGMVPDGERERAAAHAIELTITDFWLEMHDVHHPIAMSLYYEDQKPESKRRAKHLIEERMPKYLGWFEQAISGDYVFGNTISYVDTSLFHTLAGVAFAFPRASARLAATIPKLHALHDRVAARPRIAAYLASPRRTPFNNHDVFRHYPELDD